MIRTIAIVCLLSLAASAAPKPEAQKPTAQDTMVLIGLMQVFLSEPIQRARRFYRAELTEGMSLADFEARFPRSSEGFENFLNLMSFWETVGSLMQKGLVSEELAFDTFLDSPPWKKVARIFKERRERDHSPLMAVNFEWVAGRAAEWTARQEQQHRR